MIDNKNLRERLGKQLDIMLEIAKVIYIDELIKNESQR